MKNYMLSPMCLLSFLMMGYLSQAQTAFHRNSLSVSLTGGSTYAEYSTRNSHDLSALKNRAGMKGEIDPLIVEFGLTSRFGIGFSSGSASYNIDANKFYDYKAFDESKKLQANAEYFTLDFNYHPFVTRKFDFSIFGSFGNFKVRIWDVPDKNNSTTQTNEGNVQNSGSEKYVPGNSYFAKGHVLRTGLKARYYFWKRLGVMAMVTNFSGIANPRNSGDHSFGSNYSTIVSGIASEFGLCLRFF